MSQSQAAQDLIDVELAYGARHYSPLPVVLVRGEGIYLWDIDGKQYIDMMSAYSAVSHGHCNPRLLAAMNKQAQQLCVTSRAFYTDRLGPLLEKICHLTGQAMALPMNTGAEAVETALKAARKWGYQVKGIPADQAEIITCEGNFHGRTISIVGFSSEAQYQHNFGPFPAGFRQVPYGDVAALAAAITPNTAAFLVEPIQGEGGIVVPPPGYLAKAAALCREHNVLFICDEIQTGLGRSGKLLACQHDDVVPDGLLLGKALGGGIYPVSMFLASKAVMSVFKPGDHGSTFGGNPLACAVAEEALNILVDDDLAAHAARLGEAFMAQLRELQSPIISEVRGKGLLIGLEINPAHCTARQFCQVLMDNGILSKETHETVARLAPPLVITEAQLADVFNRIKISLAQLQQQLAKA